MPLAPVRATYRVAPRVSAKKKDHLYGIFSAPVKGLDFTEALVNQDPGAANVLDNFIVRNNGAELRPGSKRWVSNIPGKVLTIMIYNPPRGTGGILLPKIFAASDNGNIYDVTSAQNEAFIPPVAVAIPGQLTPGQFSWTNFSTLATNFLCICSAGGGYWTFDAAGGWVNQTGNITGPGAGAAINFDFVMAWKNRLWFIQNNTTDSWFLPTNAIAGNASNFDFGPLFTRGGDTLIMASWTVDAGNGIDDKLIIISRGGDVLAYEGTDPVAAATFRIIGRWFMGRPPNGRRFASKYGGDLLIVGPQGVDYISRILQGRSSLDPETGPNTPEFRYNEVIGKEVRDTYGQTYWHPVMVTSEQIVILLTPYNASPTPAGSHQHVFSMLPRAWSRFTAIPMTSAETLDGELYYGTPFGTVCKMFVAPTDDELSDGTPGRPVQGTLQTSYVAPGNDPMSLKIPQLLMPMFISTDTPNAKVQVNTEWDGRAPPGTPSYVPPVQALWDIAKWDVAVWAGGAFTFMGWVGAVGLGVFMSLSMTLTGAPRTLFTSWKIVYTPGGIM